MPASVNASFVFQGTVQQLKATTVQQVPVNDRTAIVRVDQVLQAPKELQHYKGQQITVQLGGDKPIKKGQHAVFYTNGWLFGESLAVQSIDHAEPAAATQVKERGDDSVAALKSQKLKEHVDDADLVITGRVMSVRVPADEPRALAEASTAVDQRFSEHDPGWQIATVAIDEVHQGEHPGPTVDVRFASSTDVRWFDAPKFHPGQEGHFLLHKQAPEAAVRVEAASADAGDYVAIHPTDFQPLEQPGGVKDLAGGPRGSDRR
jgi:hypothetical protein